MSFICEKCNKTILKGQKQHKIVIKKRPKIYKYFLVKYRTSQMKDSVKITEDENFSKLKGNKLLKSWTSKGWEIVQELRVCKECFNEKKKQ